MVSELTGDRLDRHVVNAGRLHDHRGRLGPRDARRGAIARALAVGREDAGLGPAGHGHSRQHQQEIEGIERRASRGSSP